MTPRRLGVLSLVLASIFGVAGVLALSGADVVAERFAAWGYPESFMQAVGLFELIGALGLLVPRIASVAALGLALVMAGAIYTHLFRGQPAFAIVPLVMIVALAHVAKHRLETRQAWLLSWRRELS